MTLDEFRLTLEHATPPDVAPPLLALWHDARGDWRRAHEIAQEIADATGAWVHAYLHRKEGDQPNACYWYQRADRAEATGSFEHEWERIVEDLCQRAGSLNH
jgi:hypothetical protein